MDQAARRDMMVTEHTEWPYLVKLRDFVSCGGFNNGIAWHRINRENLLFLLLFIAQFHIV